MKRILLLPLFLIVLLVNSCKAPKEVNESKNDLLTTIDKNFVDAAEQYKVMMKLLPPDRFPKTFHPATGKFETSGSEWWCSGFYPGSLLYLYDELKDDTLYNEAERMLELLKKEQFNTTTHDLGFMMYCSFGYANQIKPKPEYKDILINSAKSLSSRFSPTVGCIKSWDSKEGDFLVIIDNMMNLELLFWATEETGDSTYYNIAVTHADSTIKHHFRPDNSSYHVVNYNPATGAVQKKHTAQGAADESAWARGQAWGLYGYVVMYRVTKDEKYLDQANKIAQFMLNHPNMPADKIPYWDFNAPGIPDAKRDASASTIMASALLELSGYVEKELADNYISTVETVLTTLSTDAYKAPIGENGGFILMHGVGHIPQGTEVDVPLTYGDYYFIEAMKRYKSLKK